MVQQNFTYVGKFKLAAKTCAANNSSCYITLRTGVTSTGALIPDSSFPPADVRLTPAYSSVLAKFQSSEINIPAIDTPVPPAVSRWWKLKWIEVIASNIANDTSAILEFGSDSSAVQTKKAEIPEHFIVEQCYIHGSASGVQKRGVAVHANDVTIKDSTINEIKHPTAEGQAIWVNSATGPFMITNNYLEAHTENVMFGGSGGCCHPTVTVLATPAPTTTTARLSTVLDLEVGQGISVAVGGVEEYTEVATINAGTGDITFAPALSTTPDVPGDVDWGIVPKNLTFTKNYVTKQTSWRDVYFVKNIFELKNLDGALIEGNIFEYSWKDGQDGYAVVFTPVNQSSGNDSARVRNITFQKNIVRHAGGGLQIAGRDVSSWGDPPMTSPSGRTMNIVLSDNLFYDINSSWLTGGLKARNVIFTTINAQHYRAGGHALGPKDVTFNHNTIDQTQGTALVYFDLFKGSAVRPVENFTYQNNITRKLDNGVHGSNNCTQGNSCWTMFATGTSPFLKNVVADATCSAYPSPGSNFCPTSTALNAEFVNYGAADYHLKSTSPYKNAGTDGRDLGADIDAINELTDIALSGDNSGGGGDPTELLADDFTDNSIDTAKWTVGEITIPPADPTITVAETSAQLRIGPLKQNDTGDHYNGIVSVLNYDVTGGSAEVQGVTIPNPTTRAGMLFTLALDSSNHYRIYIMQGTLNFEKKVAGTKTQLGSVTYNATSHAYWRIRHETSNNQNLIVFEAAPDAGGGPGTYVPLHSVTREIALTSVFFELMAGTPAPQTAAPGTVAFDNFKAIRP